MGSFINMSGRVVGRLTILSLAEKRGNKLHWNCKCTCGVSCVVSAQMLSSERTRSCGCLIRETTRALRTIHGVSAVDYKTYTCWLDMVRRCENPNVRGFKNYGGRGIKVCDRWKNAALFLADMGICPAGMSIDRIDVNGNYEPGNCRWATRKEQQNNLRSNKRITFRGKTMTLSQWADEIGMTSNSLSHRLTKHGWSIDRALTTPPIPRSQRKTARIQYEQQHSPN